MGQNGATHNGSNSNDARRLCGDWSTKLKLLRYVSAGSKLKLRFVSDYSHHYGGFKARVSMENGKLNLYLNIFLNEIIRSIISTF